MGNLDSLVDEVMGLPRGTTWATDFLRTQKAPGPLAKAMPAIDARIAKIKRNQQSLMKGLKAAPTSKEARRREFDRLKAKVDRGMAEGKFTALEVSRLEAELNRYAARHGI